MKSEYEKHMFWDDNNICSNIYHEIYHIRNDVNSETDWDSKLQNLNSIRYFDTPPDNLMNYLRALHIEEYNSSHSSGTSLDEYIKYTELMVATTLPPEYYLMILMPIQMKLKQLKMLRIHIALKESMGCGYINKNIK